MRQGPTSCAAAETPANLRFVSELLLEIAGAVDVVLLSTGLDLDEHAETHLAEQTRVLARADGLVSTYGGPAYLGSFLGVPTIGIASVANRNPRHLEAARMAAAAMGTPAPTFVDHDQPGALERAAQVASVRV